MKLNFLAIALLLACKLSAQMPSSGLKIGDRIPHVEIKNFINTKMTMLNTAGFDDKLVIIDFWATSCSGCVAALPKMESLQKKFSDQLFVLPVTQEPEALVQRFWEKNKYTKNLSIPSAVEDSIFSALFPHEAVPHEVWLYKGKVIGITDAEYVDEWNISQVLSGKMPKWTVKNDYYAFDGIKQHLFKVDSNQLDRDHLKIKYTAISDYMESNGASAAGLYGSSGVVRDSLNKQIRSYFINQGIFTSYLLCWLNIRKINTLIKPSMGMQPNQIVWDVSKPQLYKFFPASSSAAHPEYLADWMRKNAICFEGVYPDKGQTDLAIAQDMIADLDRLLGLKVRWERRSEKVWKLIHVGNGPIVKPSAAAEKGERLRLSELAYTMNNEAENPYVFDETKMTEDLEMVLDIASWTDIPAIQKALAPYHLALQQEVRAVDKFIFSEVEGGLMVDGELIARAKAEKNGNETAKPVIAADNRKFLEDNKTKPGVLVTASGLQYKVIKAGTGRKPSANGVVTIHYNGTLINGRTFESTFERGKAAEFRVESLVEGLKEGLQLMNEGAKYIFYIPASLGYGDADSGNIPSKSTLIFETELIKIKK